MPDKRQQRIKDVLARVVDLPDAERDAILDEQCGTDTELRAEIESLLKYHEQETGDFVEGFRPQFAASPTANDLEGQTIGHYKIRRVIASGGMGTVYEAMQESPRRTVALKVMKHGIASRSALRRFEYESQILARLRHPCIAQVYESGTHDVGEGAVPYFAMEYIPNAKPITEYAKAKKLSTRDRLELFAKVCEAVYHGHQKGIIHRDLKPGNILVDSHGQPKVIDFGVARATDSDLAVTTLQTDVGQLIGTLQYMSPEQCDADPHDIDTRSDVYALGVVLYELVCEQLPYDLTKVAVYEAARVIRETRPARLSSFNRPLRGDIETIALKALEKERERRYSNAADLGADITRYLKNEPITARPASLAYQFRTFARRNKPVVIGTAAVFLVLVAGLIGMSILYVQADTARAQADSRLEALREVMSPHIDWYRLRAARWGDHHIHGPTSRHLTEAFRGSLEEELDEEYEVLLARTLVDVANEAYADNQMDRGYILAFAAHIVGEFFFDSWGEEFQRIMGEPWLHEAIELMESTGIAEPWEYAMTCHHLYVLLMKADRPEEAKEVVGRCIGRLERDGKTEYAGGLRQIRDQAVEKRGAFQGKQDGEWRGGLPGDSRR
ncbi:MAG: serine/threonine protein kinase [Phycisphaerales bacterium]|nr:MAG: serine/threonine protein kinase [Phycisphaerales bacterium]